MNIQRNDKYYENLLIKINEYRVNGKIHECYKILKNELDSNIYIPYKYTDKLCKILQELTLEINELERKIKYDKLSKEQMIDIFLNKTNAIDIELFLNFVDKFSDELNENDFEKIDELLSKKNLDNKEKIMIIECLNELQIDRDFDFFNIFLNKKISINPKKNFTAVNSSYYCLLHKKCKEFLYKEPSFVPNAVDIIFSIYNYYFIDLPPYDVSELSKHIVDYVWWNFDNTFYVDEKAKK
jgi:hypothetical protein